MKETIVARYATCQEAMINLIQFSQKILINNKKDHCGINLEQLNHYESLTDVLVEPGRISKSFLMNTISENLISLEKNDARMIKNS